MYLNEKLTELDIRFRFFLCSLMKDSISGSFPHSDVLPFGSTVNGFGKRGCDLDIAIRLYPEKVTILSSLFPPPNSSFDKYVCNFNIFLFYGV